MVHFKACIRRLHQTNNSLQLYAAKKSGYIKLLAGFQVLAKEHKEPDIGGVEFAQEQIQTYRKYQQVRQNDLAPNARNKSILSVCFSLDRKTHVSLRI